VADAAHRAQASFGGLKPQGYFCAITAGAARRDNGRNDDAGTMYSAYDFLERLGFVFLLTKDMLPQERADVALPTLDERVEPAFGRRGVFLGICYPNQTIWSLAIGKRRSTRWPRCG